MSNDFECPSADCPMCNGEGCNKCGAGFVNRFGEPPCEHDVFERHEDGICGKASSTTTKTEEPR